MYGLEPLETLKGGQVTTPPPPYIYTILYILEDFGVSTS